MSTSRNTRFVAAVLSAVAATCLVGTGSAQAQDSGNIFHGNDMAYWNQAHTLLQTCDYELDGHRVRAHLSDAYGQVYIGSWAPSVVRRSA